MPFASGGPFFDQAEDLRQARGVLAAPAWEETTPLALARRLHTATRLRDGTVLVAGGGGVFVFESALRFDPETTSWSPAGEMHVKRERAAATLLADGRMLVVGGGSEVSGTQASVYGLDGQWTKTEPATRAPFAATATLLENGKVLVAGGHVGDWGEISMTTEVYDPETNAWQPAGSMIGKRHNHTATRLADGRVLVAGGDDGIDPSIEDPGINAPCLWTAEIYDPAQPDPDLAWTPASSMIGGRTQHTATLLLDGRVLVAGGSTFFEQGPDDALANVEIYDPDSGTWSEAPPMKVRRAVHTATLLQNGAVLVAGGVDETLSALESAEIYDPVENTWVVLDSMANSRHEHTATLLADGRVLVVGGRDNATVEIFRLGDGGALCTIDRQCASGFCVDGVCCDSRCDGMCHFCALPGSEGACSPVPDGEDLRGVCGSGEPCADACGPEQTCVSKEGRSCSKARCDEEGLAAMSPAACEAGSASCPAPLTRTCSPYRCDVVKAACRTACSSVDDCAPGYACNLAGQCVPPPSPSGDSGNCTVGQPRERHATSGAAMLLFLGAMSLLRKAHGRSRREG